MQIRDKAKPRVIEGRKATVPVLFIDANPELVEGRQNCRMYILTRIVHGSFLFFLDGTTKI